MSMNNYDQMISFAEIRKKNKRNISSETFKDKIDKYNDLRFYYKLLRDLSGKSNIPIITGGQLDINDDNEDYFCNPLLYNQTKTKEDSKMAVVKFYERVSRKEYSVQFEEKDGIFRGMVPRIKIENKMEYREIHLDNPPTEYFPVTGSKNYGNHIFSLFTSNNSPKVTLGGEMYDISRIDYCIDEGGAQKIFLNKYAGEIITADDFHKTVEEYTDVMNRFMKQLIETDYRFKQYVKTNYGKKKAFTLAEMLDAFSDVLDLNITDADIEAVYKFTIPINEDDDTNEYFNAVYNKIVKFEIDENLRLFDPQNDGVTVSCDIVRSRRDMRDLNPFIWNLCQEMFNQKSIPCITFSDENAIEEVTKDEDDDEDED